MLCLRRMCAVALTTIAAAGTAGCGADVEGGGSGDDAAAVRGVVTAFGTASRAHDYQTICDRLLSQTLIQKLEAIGLPCEIALEKGLGDVRDPRLQVRDVAITGGRALVSVHATAAGQPPSDVAIQLVREDGDWHIASLATPGAAGPGASTATPPATGTSTGSAARDDKLGTATSDLPRTRTSTPATGTPPTATVDDDG